MPAVTVEEVLNENSDKLIIKNMLTEAGYNVKDTSVKKRISVVSDTRAQTMKEVLNVLKKNALESDVDMSPSSLRISSIGVLKIDGPINIEIIIKPATKNVLAAEAEATKDLIKIIKNATNQVDGPIIIKIEKWKIKNVVTAGSDHIRGDPKADIALIDNLNKEVGFISHKKAGGAKAFQQYGGMSKKAGNVIYTNNMVKKYVKDLKLKIGGDKAKSGQSFYRYVPNTNLGKTLVGQSVYGPKYNQGITFNRDSVHCIGQGTPILTFIKDNIFELTFSETMHTANKIDWAFKNLYKAVFASTYRAHRKTESIGDVIDNLRSGIYPYDFIAGRKALEI